MLVLVSPWDQKAMDLMGPLLLTLRENRHVLVVADSFTKREEAFSEPETSTTTVASVLVKEVICQFGAPRMLHSDQGQRFESQVMAKVTGLLGIQKTPTTPYHPQSYGQVERFNNNKLGAMLATVVTLDQRDWDLHLPFLTVAYWHETPGHWVQPQFLDVWKGGFPACGQNVWAPPGEEEWEVGPYTQDVRSKLQVAFPGHA